jgi:hypothetical protein
VPMQGGRTYGLVPSSPRHTSVAGVHVYSAGHGAWYGCSSVSEKRYSSARRSCHHS